MGGIAPRLLSGKVGAYLSASPHLVAYGLRECAASTPTRPVPTKSNAGTGEQTTHVQHGGGDTSNRAQCRVGSQVGTASIGPDGIDVGADGVEQRHEQDDDQGADSHANEAGTISHGGIVIALVDAQISAGKDTSDEQHRGRNPGNGREGRSVSHP